MSEERIPDRPPKIEALPENGKRPLWSIMIPTYNCTRYLRHTLESVLAQALPQDEMQIEVVDDYSTDGDVKEVVEEIGRGRVSFYRQPQNRGSLRKSFTIPQCSDAKGCCLYSLPFSSIYDTAVKAAPASGYCVNRPFISW